MAKKRGESSERLNQSVARVLGTQILTGEILPGEPISTEVENSAAMGVSRTAYREAVRTLVAKGLLESRPKAGTRVTPRSRWNVLDPDVLDWMFSQSPDEDFVRDLFELRSVIEPTAAEWAALRRTPHQLAEMEHCMTIMRSAPLATKEWQEADRQFHRLLLDATQNVAMISLGSSIGAAVQMTTRFKVRPQMRPHDPVPDHIAVFDAVAQGDGAQARIAMQNLLRLAFKDMRLSA